MACQCWPSVASGMQQEDPELKMHGISYSNICSVREQQDLRRTVLEMKIKDAPEAWRVVNVLLCGSRNDFTR